MALFRRSPTLAPPVRSDGWRSRTTFVLALSASAVGLGNLWRFSYLSGEYGGAPFVLTYLACLFFVAVPVMIAEVVVGVHGRAGPVQAVRHAADRSLLTRRWRWLGVLACIAGMLILALYVVAAGWGLAYANFMLRGVFSAATAAEVGDYFTVFLSDPVRQVTWLSAFTLTAVAFVIFGVQRGLGLLVWVAVPALFAMLGYLVLYGIEHGDLKATREFLFTVRWVDFGSGAALVALGHAFYTLGVGVATGVSYGAYAPDRLPIGRSVLAVAVFDALIALLAGMAIFPIVFANNIAPTYGPGLLFASLPYAFGNTPDGEWYGALFFILVVLAALGSAVAIMEPIVAALKERFHIERITAAVLVGWSVWLLGVAVAVSLASPEPPAWYGQRNLFQFIDLLGADVLLPLVCLLFAVFVGWRLRPEILRTALARESAGFFGLWRTLLRYLVPPAIILLLMTPLLTGAV